MQHRMARRRVTVAVAGGVFLMLLATTASSLGQSLVGLAAPASITSALAAQAQQQRQHGQHTCAATYTPQLLPMGVPSGATLLKSALAVPLCALLPTDDLRDTQELHLLMVHNVTLSHLHDLQTKAVVARKKTPTTTTTPPPTRTNSTPSTTSSGSSSGSGTGTAPSGGLGPCGGDYPWTGSVGLWVAPMGCFAQIFSPSAVSTGTWNSVGYCNWVVEALHHTNNLWGMPRLGLHVGAAVFFAGGVYGASAAGHWANVVSIHGSWMLIIEENFTWRGGGFGRIDYRFVPIGGGESYYG